MHIRRTIALIIPICMFLAGLSCEKDEEEGYPDYGPQEIRLDSVRNALLTTVEVYAVVSGNNEYTLNRVGLCWDTEPGTSYYLRAFTAHTEEPSYSNELAFTTWDGDVDELDGAVYVELFGYLYTWSAANNEYPDGTNDWGGRPVSEAVEDVCPDGWRLPSEMDWRELVSVVGYKSGKLKADTLWNHAMEDYLLGSDDFGFSALPGGTGSSQQGYVNLYAATGFYSSDLFIMSFEGDHDNIKIGSFGHGNYGASVRCIKNK